LGLALVAFEAAAQTTVPPAVTVPAGEYRAIRTAQPPSVDGHLDDDAWALAVPIEGFHQSQPTEGAPASQRTVVHVLYDDDALYVGARLYDTEPEAIVGHLMVNCQLL
jgi:hypothetical protein